MINTAPEPWPKGIYRIVDEKTACHEGLERLTRDGWRIVAVIERSELLGSETPQFWNSQTSRYESVVGHSPAVGSMPVFVLMLDEESAIAKMSRQIEAMVTTRREGDKQYSECDKRAKELAEALHSERIKNQSLENNIKQRDQAFVAHREKARQLETDIGKLRKAIGDLRFKEIVEGKE